MHRIFVFQNKKFFSTSYPLRVMLNFFSVCVCVCVFLKQTLVFLHLFLVFFMILYIYLFYIRRNRKKNKHTTFTLNMDIYYILLIYVDNQTERENSFFIHFYHSQTHFLNQFYISIFLYFFFNHLVPRKKVIGTSLLSRFVVGNKKKKKIIFNKF